MALYPWHKCDEGCLWWGAGGEFDCCNFENVVEEADTGRPGCRHWICASCGLGWDEGVDHSNCMIIEVELEA
jgi:hypothetical protein